MKRLAIISTHPIQYNAPLFQLLAERNRVRLKVFYTWSQAEKTVKDKTFGQDIKWDIPLLEGYDYEFITNVAKKPGSHHFFGIDCPDLIRKLKGFSPDALLVYGWSFKSHLNIMRYFHGKIPVWFRGDSTLLNEKPGLKTLLRRFILKRVYSKVDKAFYVGLDNKDYFLKHGLKEDQLVYAPHSIDNFRFGANNQIDYENDAQQWRQNLGFQEHHILIVYAGKLEARKQVKLLIDAFRVALLSNSDLRLLIVGNGPLEASLKESFSSIPELNFIPFQNQTKMPLIYRMANVFCLPSQSETWGLGINEAMASSRAVIVSDRVGCARDLVKHQKNGFIFNYDSQNQLEEILINLNQLKLKAMGAHAHNFVQKFNFEAIAMAFEETLELTSLPKH